jgi:hypothetical protein
MAQIYQKDGASLYDNNGKTFDAKTGSEYVPRVAAPPAPTPPPAATPSQPTITTGQQNPTYVPRYTPQEQAAESYLNTFQTPKSEEQIYEDKRKLAQGEIDSLNSYYDKIYQEQQDINQGRERGTNAVSVMSGLAGSSDAERNLTQTKQLNQRDNEKINAERGAAISQILSGIRSSAATSAREARLDARADAESILSRRKEKQTEAVTNLTNLAKAGVTKEGLKTSSPSEYQYLADLVGGDSQLEALFTLNRPQETILDKRVEGGKYIIAYQNPIDGKVRMETVDLKLPVGYSDAIDAGDKLLFKPDNWDGDTSKLISINKGLTPDQAADNADKADPDQLYAGLTGPTATAVRARVNAFKSEPVVQNFSVLQEGYDFASRINTATKNPADDQALIYALAKALDPGSVVREGEYATAQKYAQSWVNAYGKGITQAIAGTGFLSQQARENIKRVIETKYESSKSSYDNLYKNYQGTINNLTGRNDADKFLTDYANTTAGQSRTLRGPDGALYDASDLSDEEYQEALQDGYTEDDPLGSVGDDTKPVSQNRPTRNKNPLNIKASDFTMNFSGVAGVDPKPATDGGKFLVFKSVQDGYNAAKKLITSKNYLKLTVDAALKRWSNNGYGGEIVPSLKMKTVAALSARELDALIQSMAKREGFSA